jgi:hypothetical protein
MIKKHKVKYLKKKQLLIGHMINGDYALRQKALNLINKALIA